ncbi:hypothetical protein GCM10027288_37020 [Bordetella tumbae]
MAALPRMRKTAKTLSGLPTKAHKRMTTHAQKCKGTKAYVRKSGKTRFKLSGLEETRRYGVP